MLQRISSLDPTLSTLVATVVLAVIAVAGVPPAILMLAIGLCGIGVVLILRASARRTDHIVEERVNLSTEALREELREFEWQSSELATLYTELLEANTRAEEASRAKSRFLANMSHELRTPLTGVIGMTSLLLSSDLTSEQKECVTVAWRCGENLLELINEILDYSKIEANKLELEQLDFEVRTVIEETLESVAHQARERGLSLSSQVNPNVDQWLVGDPTRLRQILTNLVGNAVKFTHEGHVLIRCQLEGQLEENAVIVRFEVEDSGIGIPEESRVALFEPFTQADDSTTRQFGGTGLGLAISHQLAELMGGKMGIESELGRGSTFWFTVRLDEVLSPPDEPLASLDGLQGRRVLCVDDHEMTARILAEQLELHGVAAESAVGAEAAWNAILAAQEEGRPHQLVLVDLDMPEVDGWELARRLNSHADQPGIQLLALCELGARLDEEELDRLGFVGRLTKPLRESELRRQVRRALTHGDEGFGASSGTEETEGWGGGEAPLILIVEDDLVVQSVVKGMLEELGCRWDVAVNGADAVEAVTMKPFDLILMDCRMPVLNGLDATRAIRELESIRGGHVPIVALTAHAQSTDRSRCLAAGMDDYMAKPVRLPELRRVLQCWLVDATEPEELPSP